MFKAFFFAVLLLVLADAVLDHSAQTIRVAHGVGAFVSSVGNSFSDSMFSK